MKRLHISLRLPILLMLAMLLPALAAAHDFEVDGIFYNIINDNEVAVTYETSPVIPSYSGDVVIPETVIYNGTTYPVTAIDNQAFMLCSGLTSISIPSSVTAIGDLAFIVCNALTNITVDEGNPQYDSRDNCNAIIETATNKLIAGCQNTIIPNTVTTIKGNAFYGCYELTIINIPSSVTDINIFAFSYCSGLTNITVDSNNPQYDSRDNCNAIIETATNKLIVGCQSTVIPNTVSYIGVDAFCGCEGLTSISIPSSVTSIDAWAFQYCTGLTSITIPNSVTYIQIEAFDGCSSMTDVYSLIMEPSSVFMGNRIFHLDSEDYTNRTLHVPAGTLAAYQADANWYPYFGNIVEISNAVGDVDGDGNVSIGDVTNLIDKLLGGGVSVADYPAADVDSDGNITIGDVTRIIDKLLYGN